MALEYEHTSTRIDADYETQWNDAEDHGYRVVSTSLPPPLQNPARL